MLDVGGPSAKEELVIDTHKYKKISDDTSGTEAVVWTPASGKSIRIISALISVTAAGEVEIKDSTAGETIAIVEFEAIKAVPFDVGFQFQLPKDHALSAKFTVGTGTGDCHITFFGLEV